MLSRTAENLYWISRYMERAEHTARLVGMAYRMSSLTDARGEAHSEWFSILESSGAPQQFSNSSSDLGQENVSRYLILDANNPSSVFSCFEQARQNARGNRASISTEVWEAINGAWNDLRKVAADALKGSALPTLLDQVIKAVALYRGTIDGSILRDDRYDFLILGVMIERADNIARLLDACSARVIHRENRDQASTTHDWMTVLRATSSLRAYYAVYKDDISVERVADFLIANTANPRSLKFCVDSVQDHTERLATLYAFQPSCQRGLQDLLLHIDSYDHPGTDLQELGAFLSGFIQMNAVFSDQIADAFGFQQSAASRAHEGSGEE